MPSNAYTREGREQGQCVFVLVCVLASLIVSALVSASTGLYAKTSVRGLDLGNPYSSRAARALTLGTHQGYARGYDALASDFLLAARGAGRATTDFVTNATVKSHGKVIAQGTVDVRATVQGIESGTLSPRNVFRNDEGLLPPQPPGYYHEFVHPTPGVPGAGPQRIVGGQGGELFYTPDHYETFIPLN